MTFAEGAASRQAEIDYRVANEAALSEAWQLQCDRAEAAEAKLAIAVYALDSIAHGHGGLNDQGANTHDAALEALTKIEALRERIEAGEHVAKEPSE